MGKEELEIQKELIELKHKYKLEEIEAEKALAKYRHDLELEVIRIKSAEIRRQQERKEFQRFSGGYR